MTNAVPPPDAAPPPHSVPSPADLAAELARLEHQVGILHARAATAHQAWVSADQILRATLQRRDEVAAYLRAAPQPAPPAPSPAFAPSPALAGAPSYTQGVGGVPLQTSGAAASGGATLQGAAPGGVAGGEASTRTVQNLLFVLGGLLLGTAAIVFTAVAWASFGVEGRAMILAAVTLVTLALPFLALWRKLRATAETFAAIGLLLVVLDGWAAYSVNLFGAQDIPNNRYAGIVCLAAVVVAVGYGRVTRLVGPGFAALVAVQPVPLLLIADADPGPAATSLAFSALALINLGVVARHRTRGAAPASEQPAPQAASEQPAAARSADSYRMALKITAWAFYGLALSVAGLLAGTSLIVPADTPAALLAAASLVTAALLLAAAAWLSGHAELHTAAAVTVLLSVELAAIRLIAFEFPAYQLVLLPAAVAAITVLAAVVRRGLGESVRLGLTIGAGIGAGVCALAIAGNALVAAAATFANATPVWSAELDSTSHYSWQLPTAIALAMIAVGAVAPRVLWRAAAVVSVALIAVVLPSSFALAWWTPPAIDLAAAALLATIAAIARTAAIAAIAGTATPEASVGSPQAAGTKVQSIVYRLFASLATVGLVLHAIGASLARPELTAATLSGLVALGLVLAVSGPANDAISHAVRGSMFFAALGALPPAVGAWAYYGDLTPHWVARLTVGSLVLVLAALALTGRIRTAHAAAPTAGASTLRWYAFAATIAGAAVWPTIVAIRDIEAPGVYTGLSLLALSAAVALLPYHQRPQDGATEGIPDHIQIGAAVALLAATPSGLVLLGAVAPSVFAVAAAPYSWLESVWSGAVGVGLSPHSDASAQPADAVALALLALATALAGYALTRRLSSAIVGGWIAAPTAILVALVAANAAWPTVPAVTLLIGLVTVVGASIAAPGPTRTTIAAVQAVVYIGAGLGGMLATRWSTLVALGAAVVAAAIVGTAGRALGWRIVGWLGAVGFGIAAATTAILAADLRLLIASYGVLAVAVLSLALGAFLGGLGRRSEAIAVEAAAHASAVVALIYTIGYPMSAAAICAVWGVAVGLRALWPGTGRTARAALAALAAAFELLGWWLLLADRSVTVTELYTLPLAGVAVLVGWARLRAKTELGSWVAYGPALAAAFLPSLAIVLLTSGNEWRRLGLGVGALAVVVAGSVRHLRAPVLIGGAVLLILAVHEVVVWWERVPGWIPLALGGVLLVGLAITYERRRRDLARLRTALARMT